MKTTSHSSEAPDDVQAEGSCEDVQCWKMRSWKWCVPYFRHALLFPCSNAVLVTLLCSPRTPICFEKMDLLLIVLFCDANTGNIFGILGHFVPPSL